MKRFRLLFGMIACAALAIGAVSCKKDKNEAPRNENTYSFKETTYTIRSAGVRDDGEGNHLLIFSRAAGADFLMSAPETYISFEVNESNFGDFTTMVGDFHFLDATNGFRFDSYRSGAVKTVKNGDSYSLDFNFTIDDNGADRQLSGHYSGTPIAMLIDPR